MFILINDLAAWVKNMIASSPAKAKCFFFCIYIFFLFPLFCGTLASLYVSFIYTSAAEEHNLEYKGCMLLIKCLLLIHTLLDGRERFSQALHKIHIIRFHH